MTELINKYRVYKITSLNTPFFYVGGNTNPKRYLSNILHNYIKRYTDHIVNNKKYKFLKEQPKERTTGRQYCNYMGRIVLSNRYVNYKNHTFVSPDTTTTTIKNDYRHNYRNIRSMMIV